jgi:chemotaxis protein histidine kinase CheA
VVTKQLVELMGGLISVESARGVGTEFWVEFPASSSDSAAIVDKNLGIGQHSSGSPG